MNLFRIGGIAALLLAAAAVAGVAQPHRAGGAAAAGDTITVNGLGTVTTVPDRASFSFSVESRGRTASEALADNAAAARGVIAAVKGAGVAAEDVQTAEVSLSPRTSDNGETILGYTASNMITAKIRDLDRAGRVVDAAVGAGATGVDGPSLFRDDQDELYRAALKVAVAQAHAKAAALADAAKVDLGRPTSIVEGGGPVPVPLPATQRGEVTPGPPIEPGTQQIQATVTITYATG